MQVTSIYGVDFSGAKAAGRVYLLYAYAKGTSDDLSPAGRQLMQQLIALIDQEG